MRSLSQFDHYFEKVDEPRYICSECGSIYTESELRIRGKVMLVCVDDHNELQNYDAGALEKRYTEEEIKIIGSIRSSSPEERLTARRVADDVGCYVQKVAQFGGKLEREGVIARERVEELNRNIYYGPETTNKEG